jgi:type II secretory pathway pseudopilin PulG
MKKIKKNLANKGITLIALVITIIIILILARSITTNVNRR